MRVRPARGRRAWSLGAPRQPARLQFQPHYDPEAFGRFSEAIARFLGTGRYLGVAYLQRLLREPPSGELGACIDTDLDCIGAEEPTRRVAEYLATYDLLSAPVCDAQGRLLGAVSIDDVLDHLLPEAWRRGAGVAR